jgi:hypothetical protein
MTTVEQITGVVRRLPKRDLARFRNWFAEYDAALWDREFEEDVAAGRLDALATAPVTSLQEGRTGSYDCLLHSSKK